MKTFPAISILFLISIRTFAQNESLLPLFDQAKNYFNPALTGDKGKANFYAIGGYQYLGYFYNGVSSNTRTSTLEAYRNKCSMNVDFSSPVYSNGNHRISLGVYYSYQQKNERVFPIIYRNNARVNLAYSYKSKMGTFSIGTYGDLNNMKSDLGYLQARYSETGNLFNTGAGLAYRSKTERFYVGASANSLFHQYLQTKNLSSNRQYYYYDVSIYYYLISGIEIPLNKDLILSPSINIRFRYDAILATNLMAQYNKKYLFGIQYYSKDLLGQSSRFGYRLGYKTGSIAIHYAYLFSLYSIAVESGQHTIGIVGTFGK